jgi:hypothetical protein
MGIQKQSLTGIRIGAGLDRPISSFKRRATDNPRLP